MYDLTTPQNLLKRAKKNAHIIIIGKMSHISVKELIPVHKVLQHFEHEIKGTKIVYLLIVKQL